MAKKAHRTKKPFHRATLLALEGEFKEVSLRTINLKRHHYQKNSKYIIEDPALATFLTHLFKLRTHGVIPVETMVQMKAFAESVKEFVLVD